MTTFECPWCAEMTMVEEPDEHALTCDGCGIRAELAPDPSPERIARAA